VRWSVLAPVYPVPTICQVSAGIFRRGTAGIVVDAGLAQLVPELEALVDAVIPVSACGSGVVNVRRISDADPAALLRDFDRRAVGAGRTRGTCVVTVTTAVATIAADGREGVIHGLEILRQVAGGAAGARIPLCRVFDRPHLDVRAVRIRTSRGADAADLERLLLVMAGLAYNTLLVDEGVAAGAADGEAVRALAARHGIDVLLAREAPDSIVGDVIGPAAPDWEHSSRKDGINGGAIGYAGELSLKAMARAGFPYRLAYAASMLCDPDYDNFGWERVHALVLDRMPALMARLGMESRRLELEDTWAFHALPLRTRAAGPRADHSTVADVGEKVSGLVFRHALSGEIPGASVGASPPHAYRVRYRGGRRVDIVLEENLTVAQENVNGGRSWDAMAHRFVVDERLHSICSRARPVRTMSDEGRPGFMYELPWVNPFPAELVDSIELVSGSAGFGEYLRLDAIHAAVDETSPRRRRME
jgi:hypothetical protein